MSVLIQIQEIHKAYGPNVIFDGASAQFSRNDRIGFIGRNGAGKTTLCRMLLGEEEIDDGRIVKSPQLRLSYLEQGNPFESAEAVLPFLMRYTGKEDWLCGKVAARFQIKNDILSTRIGDLPGGFQTRVKLVAMLLADPNFLVLDEPTNYLDLRTLILLEHFLADYKGAFLIVSHDREFLKKTCDKTLEAEHGQLTLYPGDVEAYFGHKEEQLELARRHNKNVEQKRKQLQRFVDRFRAKNTMATRAQSKLKQISRLERIEIEHPIATARIRIPPVEPKQGVALRCEGLEIGYPEKLVAGDIRLEVERGEHVAVLGDNGQGKTTFLRTISGQLEPCGGSYRWGHNLEPAYYAQHVYSALDPELDVYTYLEQQAADGLTHQDVLDMAGSFLFSGDDVRKPIAVLSGGERARVCLAGILLGRRPVLLLDEPTNHLDFETVEALAVALRDYDGTILFISHDRTFVNLIASSIIEVKDGSVILYPGDYETYVYRTEQEVEEDVDVGCTPAKAKSRVKGTSAREERKELRSKATRLKKQIAAAERQTERYEEERQEIHRHFLENPLDYSAEKKGRADELARLLAEEEERWLSFQEELEQIEAQLGE